MLSQVSMNNWKCLFNYEKGSYFDPKPHNKIHSNIATKINNTNSCIHINKSYLRKPEAMIFNLLLNGVKRVDLPKILTIKKRTIEGYISNAVHRFGFNRYKEFIEYLKKSKFNQKYEDYKNE